MGQAESALDVHVLDQVPLFLGHLVEGTVTQDAGVVDQDIEGAESLQRGGHDLLALGHRMVVGHRLAAQRTDFGDHGVGGGAGAAQAFGGHTQVVDHDLGASGAEQQGVGAAQAVACASDNCNFAVESNFLRHVDSPLLKR
ncbi:hypothetical protein D3C76_779250 [compost metagenome]